MTIGNQITPTKARVGVQRLLDIGMVIGTVKQESRRRLTSDVTEYFKVNDCSNVVLCDKCIYLKECRVVFKCSHPKGLKEPNPKQNTYCCYGEKNNIVKVSR